MKRHADRHWKTIAPALGPVVLTAVLAVWGHPSSRGPSPAPQAPPQNDPANLHTVTVTFNYDFKANPSCAEKPKLKSCTKQFVVYDVSGPKIRLFSIPVPQGASGFVTGITAESPPRILIPGKHFIAVMAQNPAGAESQAARTAVEVKPKTMDPNSQTNPTPPSDPNSPAK